MIRNVLCDIEGTTTSIDFVKDVLFPFARTNAKKYLQENFADAECQDDIDLLIEQSKLDVATYPNENVPVIDDSDRTNKDKLIDSIGKNIFWQIDLDKKTKALKQIQGHIWKSAYERGDIKGHVYDDVPSAFERWTNNGSKISIYSSGSVQAQKLLFAHSKFGDLTKYLWRHYDTNVGSKTDRQSYSRIVDDMDCQPNEILFLTDIVNEAKAASAAGLRVCVVYRPDNNRMTFDKADTEFLETNGFCKQFLKDFDELM